VLDARFCTAPTLWAATLLAHLLFVRALRPRPGAAPGLVAAGAGLLASAQAAPPVLLETPHDVVRHFVTWRTDRFFLHAHAPRRAS